MAIPEHAKCVACHKRIRESRHKQTWVNFRKARRKAGKLKPKQRIKLIIDLEHKQNEQAVMKRLGHKTIREHRIWLYGSKYYRRYGKYDD